MSNLIELNHVTKTYGKKIALHDVSFTIPVGGKIIGLLGPNGSGKTTLIKTIMRIIRHQDGEILVNGIPVSYETRKYISFMPDREYLYDTMTVQDSIDYYNEMFNDFDINRAYSLCQKLGLNVNDPITSLSKGNKEKNVLMLTLARKVPIYLLDEPLGSLDPVIKHQMLNVIKEISTPDNVIVISTHLIKDTSPILDSAIFLKNGNVANFFDINSIGKDLEEYYLEVFSNV